MSARFDQPTFLVPRYECCTQYIVGRNVRWSGIILGIVIPIPVPMPMMVVVVIVIPVADAVVRTAVVEITMTSSLFPWQSILIPVSMNTTDDDAPIVVVIWICMETSGSISGVGSSSSSSGCYHSGSTMSTITIPASETCHPSFFFVRKSND